MAQGRINGQVSGKGVYVAMDWQSKENIAGNYSDLTFQVKVWRQDRFKSHGSGSINVTIDGQTYSKTGYTSITSSVSTIITGTKRINHNSDGTKKVSVSFSGSINAPRTFSGGGTITLPTIPRASDIFTTNTSGSRISSADLGTTIRLNINKKHSGFTSTLRYAMHSESGTIVSKTGATQYNYQLPNGWIDKFLANLTSSHVTFYVDTYSGNQLIGTRSVRLDVKVPAHIVPTIGEVTLSEANTSKASILGATPYYQILTRLRVSVSASGARGSTIKSTKVEIWKGLEWQSVTGTTGTFKPFSQSGIFKVRVIVTDSRGRSITRDQTVEFEPYSLPAISLFSVSRRDNNTQLADARIATRQTVIENPNKNPLTIKVECRPKSGGAWETAYSATSNTAQFSQLVYIGGHYDPYASYDVRLTIADKFHSNVAIKTLPTAQISFVLGSNKPVHSFNKVPGILSKGLEIDGGLYVSDKAQFNDDIQLKHPRVAEALNIIESGSNANGEYIKLYDGTLICYRRWTATNVISHDEGNDFYRSGHQWWVYPYQFKAVPMVFIAPVSDWRAWGTVDNPGWTSTRFVLWRKGGSFAQSCDVNAIAIGRGH